MAVADHTTMRSPEATGPAAALPRPLRLQLLASHSGFVAPVVALVALFGSGVFPPQRADSSAAQIAAFYGQHTDLKIAGLFVGFMAIGLLGPLVAVISLQMLRVEGRHPLMSFLQLVCGAVTWAFLSIPLLMMLVAAYRVDGRSAEMTQTIHDLAWVLFLIPIAPFIAQNVAIATAVLGDESPDPVFPRWVAWANLFIAASFVPDAMLGFVKTGPFAVHGVFAFWIPTVTYGTWLILMGYACRRAVLHDARTDATP